jgi:hypothetical protein
MHKCRFGRSTSLKGKELICTNYCLGCLYSVLLGDDLLGLNAMLTSKVIQRPSRLMLFIHLHPGRDRELVLPNLRLRLVYTHGEPWKEVGVRLCWAGCVPQLQIITAVKVSSVLLYSFCMVLLVLGMIIVSLLPDLLGFPIPTHIFVISLFINTWKMILSVSETW